MSSIYVGAGQRMLTKYSAVYPYCVLGHTIHFCQYGVQSAVEIKDLMTETSEIFPLGEKERELLKQWNTIIEAKSD